MKKRYAVCGVSMRAIFMYIQPMMENFSPYADFVAMLDIDPLRFDLCKERIPSTKDVPTYMADEFEKMLEEQKPDALIVVCMDSAHKHYIVEGLKHDLEVICEKPMTTNTKDALEIREVEKKSKGKLICTFNYRYTAAHTKLKEMILDGKIGRVTHVDLNWYIDIHHGASYFNRWNRMRENSGSLSIHKSSHHFDLVNWWINGIPQEVHAFGALNHYGPEGPFNPSKKDGRHCTGCPEFRKCAYQTRFTNRVKNRTISDDFFGPLKQDWEKIFTDYTPDKCLFDKEINIFDTYVVNVRYKSGAFLNYSANFSTPYEGYRLAINGTHGRLETTEFGGIGGSIISDFHEGGSQYIDYYPIFEGRERIHMPRTYGGHGGGDPKILEDIFIGEDPDRKYDILAKSVDGLRAISIGDAVYNSIVNGGVQDLSSFME
ncbi:MAG: Gfo/Idh/MocA family oxidoreductase [Lentisphaeria bacterium]|nr:Gfo/Idh/MocA family oxidoreductase [Lentisphaeria bacterium]